MVSFWAVSTVIFIVALSVFLNKLKLSHVRHPSQQNHLYCISSMASRYPPSFVALHKAVQSLCRHLVCFHKVALA